MSDTRPGTEPGDSRDDASAGDAEGYFHPAAPQEREAPPQAPEPAPTVALPPVTPPAEPVGGQVAGAVVTVLRNWPVAIILAALAVAAMIVPTLVNVATTDDWGYTRSVEILLDTGELKVFPVVAATAVGQILWGALFGSVFGMSLGVMRLSTVVMVALGGVGMYAILRQLGVSRSRSAIGMGVWIFNPVTFALAFSFMTDAHFASMMLISIAFYVRGLRPGRENLRFVVAGSFFAAFAFLMRQQGALIPLGVGTWLLLTGRLWFRWSDLRRLLAVALVPALTLVAYYAWLRWFNDVPDVQQTFFDEVRDAGWEGTWLLVRRVPIYTMFYAGIILVPVLAAIFPWKGRDREVSLFSSPVTFHAFLVWTAVVAGGLYFAGRRGQEMPFVPQFAGLGGLGPPDVLGSRQRLVERDANVTFALTIIAAVAAVALGLVICRRLVSEASPERAGFWLVASIGFWQLAGVLPPSYHYLHRGVTLDRYLLPVIAILIIAAMWALRDINLFQPVAWVLLAAVATFSVAGVRDYLVFMDAVWDMADHANAGGVTNDRLDAGSAWDGYHLYTIMLDENITKAKSPPGSPWWVYFYAKPTDSSYIVATDPKVRAGYVVAESREYDQWLEDDPVQVYLLRRWYTPFPVSGRVPSVWNSVTPAAALQPEPTTIPATPPASPVATPGTTPAAATPRATP